jgi:ComEC/Rec2-related protein
MYVIALTATSTLVSLRRHNVWTLVWVTMLAFSIGWWRGGEFAQKLAVNQSFYDSKVTLVGRATEDAVYGRQYQLEFSLADAQIVEPYSADLVGSLTVRGFGEAAIYKGDMVQVSGKLRASLGNNISSVSYASLRVISRDTSWINDLRRRFAAGVQSALPEPMAPFVLGLLIGQRSTLPDDISDQLKHVGLTHIIAVSGYNLTIIVEACRRLLAKRSKYQTTASCLLLIGAFLLITGLSPPIVRASIVSALSLWAWYYGRKIQPLVLLLVSAAITLIANPLYLWGNVSWYLSFLSFFGVLVVAPVIAKRLFKTREPKMFASVVIETIAASILVVPYALYIFGQVSLISLPANVLIVPLIPLAMLLGLCAGLGGMLLPVIAGWLAWPATILLTYILDVVAIFNRVPHAFVEGVAISGTQMAGMYGTMGVVFIILRNKISKQLTLPPKAYTE